MHGELIVEPERPPHHHYHFREIELFLKLILSVGASIRGASKTLQVLLGQFPRLLLGAPTYNCGRMWLMRVGLYELQRTREFADDWVWIIDHTVQVGVCRSFVVIACRLSQLGPEPLEHRDYQVLAIEPAEKSNAELIAHELEKLVGKTSAPRAILSDGCRELTKGIALFRQKHPTTVGLYDVKHKAALFLKKALLRDERWAAFNTAANKARQATQTTALAHLAPPSQRTKGRFMNLQPLVKWGGQMLQYLAAPFSPAVDLPLEPGPINIHFRWLLEFREDIAEWSRMIAILETATEYSRQHGYHRGNVDCVAPQLRALADGPRSQQIVERVLAFQAEQGALAGPGEHLPASSECIESLIAKGKHIEKQQASSGFTCLVLAMAAAVVPLTRRFIASALEQVKTKDVLNWAKEKLGLSVQAKRQRTLGKVGAEQKQHKIAPPPHP